MDESMWTSFLRGGQVPWEYVLHAIFGIREFEHPSLVHVVNNVMTQSLLEWGEVELFS